MHGNSEDDKTPGPRALVGARGEREMKDVLKISEIGSERHDLNRILSGTLAGKYELDRARGWNSKPGYLSI